MARSGRRGSGPQYRRAEPADGLQREFYAVAAANAARELQGTVEWPGAGAWAGAASEPSDALAAVVSAQRIRVSAVSRCSP
jgi:hypothetical protein